MGASFLACFPFDAPVLFVLSCEPIVASCVLYEVSTRRLRYSCVDFRLPVILFVRNPQNACAAIRFTVQFPT
jgi:hypothetical protein